MKKNYVVLLTLLAIFFTGDLANAKHHPGRGGHGGGNPGQNDGQNPGQNPDQSPDQNPGKGTGGIPDCMDKAKVLPIDNNQVIQWKASTPNTYLARAHVNGPVTRQYPDHSGHTHFEISIGKTAQDTLEVIYNDEFGALPAIRVGMNVEACGDYITSTAQSGPYPPSPDGAIIHWIHKNPRGHGHDSGFIAIDNVLYGQGNGNPNHGN